MPTMRVPLKWLSDYVDLPDSIEELDRRITAAGNEVSKITRLGEWHENIIVAQILNIEPHPNADRLRLATVSLGDREQTVVCGAPNIEVGQRVPIALVGAELTNYETGERQTLKAARIRGVASNGMLCSERELGLSENHDGILVLPGDAPVGSSLHAYLGDTVLDIDVTPNRADCLSVLGIAREVSAIFHNPVREPDPSYPQTLGPVSDFATVEIADADLCPRYTGIVLKGVKIGPSPAWMQQRLEAAGMRPINNVVDVTNYVMLEYGQPLHAFDYDRLRGHAIIVRRARPGERMTTLDGLERELTPDMLLICDAGGPVAIAGVMGGMESEVTEGTTSILLESAHFNNINIRRTSLRLGLRSEASVRFEKGLTVDLPVPAAQRAAQLILQTAGGAAAQGMIDAYPDRRERAPVLLTSARIRQVMGIDYPQDTVAATLTALGCVLGPAPAPAGGFAYNVTPPFWRNDLSIPDDLVEEVSRIVGYDEIPAKPIGGEVPPLRHDPARELKESAKDVLVALGFQEIITYSLVSMASLEKLLPLPAAQLPPLRVANPMSAEQEYLRTSLRASLLTTLADNARNAVGLRLFEVGRVYLPTGGQLPDERETLVLALAGSEGATTWQTQPTPADYFTLKGLAEALFDRLGIDAAFEAAEDANLHPGRTARIVVDGAPVGVIGELHPVVAARFDLDIAPVLLLEVDLKSLLPHVREVRGYRPMARYPGVVEDMALVVDADMAAERVLRALRRNPLVVSATLFDVYTGAQVPAGKKSLAYSVTYQSPVRTLTNAEVVQARTDLLATLAREVGAVLRG